MTAPTAAYLHIPFCRRRCFYCDFPVSIVGDHARGETSGAIAQYVEALCHEVRTTPAQGKPLQTVFFGGGTPSLLSVAQLERILETLDRHFEIAPSAEISIEMDPGTFDLSHLKGYCAAGINRVSLGVQSFQTEQLQACGRTHTVADVYEAIALIHQVGVSNFSLDLISGLPHQTLETWHASVEAAIAIAPTHLSVYDLIVEPVTAFGRWYQPGESPLPSDVATAEMYRLAQQRLTQAGYDHYEISNYAKPGYQCRHNRVYWENQPYYGFGMGAASYVLGQRFTRPRKRQEYFQWVQALADHHGTIDCPITPSDEVLLDTLMLGLRLAEGISLTALQQQFGEVQVQQLLQRVQPYQQQGWVEIDSESCRNRRIRLTDPEGFLFSNVVLTRLFEET
ncbi:MAG: radical SAM family heme chaperone HemW [Oculatellaceae cyanobacterium bins.114]|nr:radical SAM family heme chaperone HemW [Oculatellaceae cyanobacterium bins.114]